MHHPTTLIKPSGHYNKAIWFDSNLLRSPAYRSLSKWAMLAYMDFLRKRQMEEVKIKNRSSVWNIKNNGEIVYPYADAERKGIGRREFRNAIDELIQKGFLDIAHQGTGGRSGDMTKYVIDKRWRHYDTPEFIPANKARQKDDRKGRGWSAYHAKKEKISITKLIPEKAGSSNKSGTPDGKVRKLSSSKSDIPKDDSDNVTINNHIEKRQPKQPLLWSDNSDTIL